MDRQDERTEAARTRLEARRRVNRTLHDILGMYDRIV